MQDSIELVRAFNRFFTSHVGAIDARFLNSEINLPEARLLFEIANREPVTASELKAALKLDPGYLSRMIRRFEDRDWIIRDREDDDSRMRPVRLTDSGRTAFELIDLRQREVVSQDLERLGAVERDDLVQALSRARLLLDREAASSFSIRQPKAGEVSLVAARQSALYAESHAWGFGLETLEAETTAAFLRDFDPDRERCWIAEVEGVMAGAVFLTDDGYDRARLRLLYVEPFARRRGIADALVRECISFGRRVGYRNIRLWTHTVLDDARRLYARHGFERIATEMHHEFGEPVQGETWDLRLTNCE